MKKFSLDIVIWTLTNSPVTTAANDNQAPYDFALIHLGRQETALVSQIIRVDRGKTMALPFK